MIADANLPKPVVFGRRTRDGRRIGLNKSYTDRRAMLLTV